MADWEEDLCFFVQWSSVLKSSYLKKNHCSQVRIFKKNHCSQVLNDSLDLALWVGGPEFVWLSRVKLRTIIVSLCLYCHSGQSCALYLIKGVAFYVAEAWSRSDLHEKSKTGHVNT